MRASEKDLPVKKAEKEFYSNKPIYKSFFAFYDKIQGKIVVLSFKTKENKLVMNLMSMLNILNASLSTFQMIICSHFTTKINISRDQFYFF